MATGDGAGIKGTQVRSALQSVPPQRRAQMLLLNIAGLTSHLVEISGSKDWQSGQNKPNVPQFLPGAVLPLEGSAATNSKDVLAILDSHQTLLFEALGELAELQEMENEKQRIADAIAAKDLAMRDFAKRLRDALQVLETSVENFEVYKRPKRSENVDNSGDLFEIGLGTLNVKELVSYAHRISYTTFAPPEYAEGAPLRGALPPAPQDEQMRASKLYQINELDLGLPKPVAPPSSHVTGVDSAIEQTEEVGASSQLAHVVPGSLLPPLPAGWKPGMPVELPVELPPMPPGWKPGDPIPLPSDMPPLPPAGWKPGDAVVLPPSFQPFPGVEGGAVAGPIKAPPVAGPVVPLAPSGGPIFVPFVQLDLNPELEDEFGSEYSEEDGSSDDDDD